ncbi:RNA polymerase Rpc34 [Xylariales sp. PMI_506]|nr:RNA polymerase Rpc34 [Xylariales sp. PMI_506]
MDRDKISILKDQLYAACQSQLDGDDEKAYNSKVFTQEDLQNLDVIPPKDLKTLAQVIHELTEEYLFIVVNTQYGAAWRLRQESEALKYHTLDSQEQVLVYSLIDNSSTEGIWQQEIRKKTNIRDQTLKKVLKELETQKKLITSFTSVQQVSHRCYIKANLKPSDKATGGPWFADGDLDESFIATLLGITYNLIKESGSYYSASGGVGGAGPRSASSSPVLPKKGIVMGSASDAAVAARGKKRPADAMTADDEVGANGPSSPKARRKLSHRPVLLPMPAGFKGYLTLPEITQKIADVGITKGIPLKEADIQQLVDVLVFDSRIEEVKVGRRRGYRAVRVTKADPQNNISLDDDTWEPPSNGLTTAPCGRCPVFELCEEGGPVWAGGCEYFDRWLI